MWIKSFEHDQKHRLLICGLFLKRAPTRFLNCLMFHIKVLFLHCLDERSPFSHNERFNHGLWKLPISPLVCPFRYSTMKSTDTFFSWPCEKAHLHPLHTLLWPVVCNLVLLNTRVHLSMYERGEAVKIFLQQRSFS